jgi:hypothetical protein
MIALLNHGTLAAQRLANVGIVKTLLGEAGQQLGVDWDDLKRRPAVRSVEFGIIAGGMVCASGPDPLQPGGSDGRITVETTRLVGAAEFVLVPAVNELIANDPRTHRYTLRFLEEGYFVSAEQRRPILD